MSDAFWVALAGVLVAALGGLFKLIQMQMLMQREMVRNAQRAEAERAQVMAKVDKVEDKVNDAERKEEQRHEETLQFQKLVLSSDVFDAAKLAAMIEKRRSGFGELDP